MEKSAYVNFTIRPADYLRKEFRKYNLQHNLISTINAARRTSSLKGHQAFGEIWGRVEDKACHVVFGSNQTEDRPKKLSMSTISLREHRLESKRGKRVDALDA
ncbi:hypothetical protein F5B21DRAFT_493627 [Xylaria acuta]|nr:hypothetical protein F5B21DRAFT_493627 [Xylaria acuta]